jgi:hypothetical protein
MLEGQGTAATTFKGILEVNLGGGGTPRRSFVRGGALRTAHLLPAKAASPGAKGRGLLMVQPGGPGGATRWTPPEYSSWRVAGYCTKKEKKNIPFHR